MHDKVSGDIDFVNQKSLVGKIEAYRQEKVEYFQRQKTDVNNEAEDKLKIDKEHLAKIQQSDLEKKIVELADRSSL